MQSFLEPHWFPRIGKNILEPQVKCRDFSNVSFDVLLEWPQRIRPSLIGLVKACFLSQFVSDTSSLNLEVGFSMFLKNDYVRQLYQLDKKKTLVRPPWMQQLSVGLLSGDKALWEFRKTVGTSKLYGIEYVLTALVV